MLEKSDPIHRILEECRLGKREGQRKLFEHFFGYAMNICLRYSRSREEAEEVLNNAFLKVFSNLDKYDPSYPFKTWFRSLLIHAAVDYYRINQKYPVFLELQTSMEISCDSTPIPPVLSSEDVLPILQKLTPGYRIVFNLSVMEGYSHEEIAELLGISASASRSNLARAKEKLRSLMAGKRIIEVKRI